MRKEKVEVTNFYQALGYLFYAVAAADKVIHRKEVDQLRQNVLSEWQRFDEESAFLIEITFDELVEQKPDANDCFNAFKVYKAAHEKLFQDNVKERIWKTVNAIASASAGKNKSELVLLSKLSSVLST